MSKRIFLAAILLVACDTSDPNPAARPDAGGERVADAAASPDAEVELDAGALAEAGENSRDGSVVSPDLEMFILEKMVAAGTPGLAAAIVKNGAIAWEAGFGHANIEEQRPVTPDSVFILASISKTPIAVAAMQLVEQNLLDLDNDLSQILPFEVRNPSFPEAKITLRMLLTHTSSLLDSAELDMHTVDGDSPISLRDFVEGYITPNGAYYQRDNWSSTAAPGTTYEYSNSGASLAAYVVEAVAAEDYALYTTRTIFQPLSMTNTSYRLAGLDRNILAMPYSGNATSGYMPYGHYGYPDYPDGALRASVHELARFMMMFMNRGELDSVRVLAPSSVDEISRAQIPSIDSTQGLIWYYINYAGRRMIGHNGSYLGTSTDMYFDPSDGVGFIVLTNGDTYLYGTDAQIQALDDIERRILEEAARL